MRTFLLAMAALCAVLLGAHLVFSPPPLEGRTVSKAVEASTATPLGRVALTAPEDRGGDSGVLPLIDGPDAFAARIALIRAAERALDVQYYIWHRDATGLILLNERRRAAERGVRIRLLLDDNGIAGLDRDLAALDALPNVEVRLFNPFILRTPKVLGYAFDFFRLNRRMHNKSLTADSAMSILGGRNIGDVYFAFGDGVQYIDTDVLVTGAVTADISADFDCYWASRSAYPADGILPEPDEGALAALTEDASAAAGSAEGRLYAERLQRSDIVAGMKSSERWYRLAVRIDRHDPVIPFNLGNVLDAQGRAKEAAFAFGDALARDLGFAEAWLNLAVMADAGGGVEEAEELF